MKKIGLYVLVVLGLSCKSNKQELVSVVLDQQEFQGSNTLIESLFVPSENPYTITFKMEEVGNEFYDLKIHMQLNDGAYYVSPNSKRNFKGIFSMHMNTNVKLERIEKLLESPLSVEEYDSHPFVNGYVNWVRENTMYTQRFRRKSDNNFKVSGMIQFTIEPNCTLEQIPFLITYTNGAIKIENVKC